MEHVEVFVAKPGCCLSAGGLRSGEAWRMSPRYGEKVPARPPESARQHPTPQFFFCIFSGTNHTELLLMDIIDSIYDKYFE